VSFPRLFHPGCVALLGGFPVPSLGIPGTLWPRVAFRLRRSMTQTPDSLTLAIYGLAPEQRLAIQAAWTELGKARVGLSCGYDGAMQSLFLGDARSITASSFEPPEFVTRAVADDGGDALADAVFSGSTIGIDAKTMIDVALRALNLPRGPVSAGGPATPIVAHPSVAATLAATPTQATVLFYGSVTVGKASDLLTEAARLLGARWWIRDGLLHMAKFGIPIDPGIAVLLPRTHWLAEPVEDGAGSIRVSTFLDPQIVPGRQVQLIGRTSIASVEPFRVEVAEYTGDTDSANPFSVTFDARRIV